MAEDADDNGGKGTTDLPVDASTQDVDPAVQDDASQRASVPAGTDSTHSDLTQSDLVASELLHAAHVLPPDMIANVELTLDHLSTTVDLFDVPPFDYGDTGGDAG
jgi:hypothetical protein